MRVLVAGATGTLGRATVAELVRRGHDVVALTRSAARAASLASARVTVEVADVLDAEAVQAAVQRARPEAVVSLLITLPKNGPTRFRHYGPTRRLWKVGVPHLLDAAAAAGVQRVVAESVLFAYGYRDHGTTPLDESAPLWEGGTRAQNAVLGDLRDMEQRVLSGGGTVLRYGVWRGAGVPTEDYLARLLRRRVPVLPGGGHSVLSFVEIGDAARATAAAVEAPAAARVLNVCDDRPVEFAAYAAAVARRRGLPRPRSIPSSLVRAAMPLTALIVDEVRIPLSNERARAELGWSPTSGAAG